MSTSGVPDGTAYIVITATTGIALTLLFFLMRLYIRLRINKPFLWDDTHCAIATFLALLSSALTLLQTRYGLGQHLDSLTFAEIDTQRLLAWVAVLAYNMALAFSMLSMCFLIVRVTKLTSQATPAYIAAGMTAIWAICALGFVAFQCKLPYPWRTRPRNRCLDIYELWLGLGIARTLLETANVIIAVTLVWRINMPVRPKIWVVALFALRLLVLPPTLIRLRYIKQSWRSEDWSYARVDLQIITQVVLHLSVILATVPCVKSLLTALADGRRAHTPTLIHESKIRAKTSMATEMGPILPRSRSTLALDGNRRAKSAFDLRRDRTILLEGDYDNAQVAALQSPYVSIRPGPRHQQRMKSWPPPPALGSTMSGTMSEGMGPSSASQNLSTAEHDSDDARAARLERRSSAASGRIKWTRGFEVESRQMERRQSLRALEEGFRRERSEANIVWGEGWPERRRSMD